MLWTESTAIINENGGEYAGDGPTWMPARKHCKSAGRTGDILVKVEAH